MKRIDLTSARKASLNSDDVTPCKAKSVHIFKTVSPFFLPEGEARDIPSL